MDEIPNVVRRGIKGESAEVISAGFCTSDADFSASLGHNAIVKSSD